MNPNGEITMDDLLREAIADAKAVRETALANAKIDLRKHSHRAYNLCYQKR